eukprot:9972723-Alexandrium_andersonii.AAC.1
MVREWKAMIGNATSHLKAFKGDVSDSAKNLAEETRGAIADIEAVAKFLSTFLASTAQLWACLLYTSDAADDM